jgi:hypothetical protein
LIEKINGPMLFQLKATPAEYKAGLDRAIANGWLVLHESGTFLRFTQIARCWKSFSVFDPCVVVADPGVFPTLQFK